jgi:hypothetical protein
MGSLGCVVGKCREVAERINTAWSEQSDGVHKSITTLSSFSISRGGGVGQTNLEKHLAPGVQEGAMR